MKICEIFTSIQGESSYSGIPCTFIRFSGCNLRCAYCDTEYAYDEGTELSEDEIINELSLVGVKLVEITGGEPLLQDGVHHLIERLLNDSHKVLVETNGSQSVKDIDPRAVIILDIKTPGSGMATEMDFSNLDYLKPIDEVKFVLTGRGDYEWAKEMASQHFLYDKCTVLFSPVFGVLPAKSLVKWIIEDRLDVRLNLQIHKYIFDGEKESRRI